MTRLLRTLFLLSLTLSLLVSLIPAPAAPSAARAQTAESITLGVTDLPANLDPALLGDFMGWELLRHLYTGLTRQVPGTNDYELALAASHDVSQDGLTHTFTIRPDAAFNDGTPITAQTFADSIQRVLDINAAGADLLEDIGLTVAVDDEEDALLLTTARPIPYMEGLVALPPFFAVDVSDFPSGDVQRNPTSLNSNGPFILAEWDPGTHLHLQTNPDYAYGPAPLTATIILRNYTNPEDLRQAITNGDVDLTWRAIRLEDALEVTEQQTNLRLITTPSSRMWYLVLNSEFDYVDDPAVREATRLIIDRERIVTETFGELLAPAYSLLPSALGEVAPSLWEEAPDPTTAEQLLRDANYRESSFNQATYNLSTSLPGYGNRHASVTRSLVRDMRAVRVLSLSDSVNNEFAIFVEALTNGDMPAAIFAWTPPVMHPQAYLYPLLHSDGPLATTNNYASPDIDALLDEAALSGDPARYREAQRLVRETDALIPLWQDALLVVAVEGIGGVTVAPNHFLDYSLLVRE